MAIYTPFSCLSGPKYHETTWRLHCNSSTLAPHQDLHLLAFCAEFCVSQSLLDFSGYIKFFVGLFALVNPVGILPVFISMTSYQAAAGRNKTNMTANLSVAIILWTALFLGDAILHIFGISIDSFRIAGGILVVSIAMSMISGKLGEDKQNKQEKSETAIRENVGVVPLALPLMAGPGAISSTIVWSSRFSGWQNLRSEERRVG